MPEITVDTDDYEMEYLEAVRQREGLETCDQALEFLVRKSIREGNRRLTGRGRALYPVKPQGGHR
ncbi:hypothetical protein FIU88_05665 [Halomonas sp. THAF12]|uniref:hypothetical protein n=1 Tax=Halomonas sp. THAF12 TaxID=2587849 RepID=UPI0012695B29|nr:hypothetical protein [Halomonas sp. THAF12]QFT84466.1 hypothetical protein FIU88_05665 [Halomonas sp. THAF12]